MDNDQIQTFMAGVPDAQGGAKEPIPYNWFWLYGKEYNEIVSVFLYQRANHMAKVLP